MDADLPTDRRVANRIGSGNLVIHADPDDATAAKTRGVGVTLDVNEFGLRVQATEPMPLGESFRFSIALRDEVIHAVGKIVHIERALNGTFEMGIEFLEIPAGDIERIQRFLSLRKSETTEDTPPL